MKNKNPIYAPSVRFGELLRLRRTQAGLSRAQLAARAQIATGTIKNLERGRHGPLRSTVQQLCAVPELQLSVAAVLTLLGSGPHREPVLWLPGFDPVALSHALASQLLGPGGGLDPTLLYLDSASAAAWLAYAAHDPFLRARHQLPLGAVARAVVAAARADSLELWALGCGDGQQEIALARELHRGYSEGVALILLDINQALLYRARERAIQALGGALAVQGDLWRLPSYYPIGAADAQRCARLFCLLGGTLGALSDEARFFEELLGSLREGDLVLLDAHLPAPGAGEDDAGLRPSPELERWFIGLFERYSVAPADALHLSAVVQRARGTIAGGYLIDHRVRVSGPVERSFSFLRQRRYPAEALTEALQQSGLHLVEAWLLGNQWGLWLLRRGSDGLQSDGETRWPRRAAAALRSPAQEDHNAVEVLAA